MNKNHTPLFRISKRGPMPWYHAWGVRAAAIVLALIVCAVLSALLTGEDPMGIYKAMIDGALGSSRRRWILGQNTAILLIFSLAVTPAFRMRFWNIGAEGQVLVGSLATAACMILLGDKIPNWALICLMGISAIVVSAVWAGIPAIFKAKFNTNETLFTLMMNYVAIQLVAFFVIKWEVPKGAGKIGIINQQSNAGWLPAVFDQKYLLSILVALALTIALYVYLKYSKQGYEISVVGESERTARYIGIKVDKVIIRTLLVSGAVCGVAGFLLVGSINHTLTTTLAAGRGFTAVMVSWLAKFNPIAMVFTSLLIAFLERGSAEITSAFDLNHSFTDILTGIILFFIIGCEFFINYKISFHRSAKEEGKTNA